MSTQPGPGQQPGQFHPQGQPAYQTGGLPGSPATPPPGAPAPAKQRNILAIVALVLAVAGLVFAVIEGAYILGWLLLPAAFVMSIVALVVRDRPRRMAVAALVISIVGTIAGGIAFMSSAAGVIEDSLSAGEATVVASAEESTAAEPSEPSEPAEEAQPEADEPSEEAPAGPDGTRENPFALGTTVANDEWEVTVNSFTADATDEVMAENEFNDEPVDGSVYALINLTLTRVAAESGTFFEVDVAYVTDGGNVVTGTEGLAVAPDEMGYDELYEGGTVTGNVLVEIPAGATGTVRVTPGLFADDVFFATS